MHTHPSRGPSVCPPSMAARRFQFKETLRSITPLAKPLSEALLIEQLPPSVRGNFSGILTNRRGYALEIQVPDEALRMHILQAGLLFLGQLVQFRPCYDDRHVVTLTNVPLEAAAADVVGIIHSVRSDLEVVRTEQLTLPAGPRRVKTGRWLVTLAERFNFPTRVDAFGGRGIGVHHRGQRRVAPDAPADVDIVRNSTWGGSTVAAALGGGGADLLPTPSAPAGPVVPQSSPAPSPPPQGVAAAALPSAASPPTVPAAVAASGPAGEIPALMDVDTSEVAARPPPLPAPPPTLAPRPGEDSAVPRADPPPDLSAPAAPQAADPSLSVAAGGLGSAAVDFVVVVPAELPHVEPLVPLEPMASHSQPGSPMRTGLTPEVPAEVAGGAGDPPSSLMDGLASQEWDSLDECLALTGAPSPVVPLPEVAATLTPLASTPEPRLASPCGVATSPPVPGPGARSPDAGSPLASPRLRMPRSSEDEGQDTTTTGQESDARTWVQSDSAPEEGVGSPSYELAEASPAYQLEGEESPLASPFHAPLEDGELSVVTSDTSDVCADGDHPPPARGTGFKRGPAGGSDRDTAPLKITKPEDGPWLLRAGQLNFHLAPGDVTRLRGRIKAGDVLSSEAVLRSTCLPACVGWRGWMPACVMPRSWSWWPSSCTATPANGSTSSRRSAAQSTFRGPSCLRGKRSSAFPPKPGTLQEWAKKVERLRAYHFARPNPPGRSSGHVPKPACSPKRAASIAVKSTRPRKPKPKRQGWKN